MCVSLFPTLSISIVSYNTRDYLKKCLHSLYNNNGGICLDVIVVDNASGDGSHEMVTNDFPEVRLICNQENLMFTYAHNQALKVAQGKYFLVLNPDTEIPPRTLEKTVKFLENNPTVGAVGCQERHLDSSIEYTGSRLSTPWIEFIEQSHLLKLYHFRQKVNGYRMKNWDRRSNGDVDVLTNCFLMLPTKLLMNLGGHEERLLLYFSENDLCLRLKQRGYRVHFLADCYYLHDGQKSTIQLADANAIYRKDMFTYYRKHFGPITVIFMQIAFWIIGWLINPLVNLYLQVLGQQ